MSETPYLFKGRSSLESAYKLISQTSLSISCMLEAEDIGWLPRPYSELGRQQVNRYSWCNTTQALNWTAWIQISESPLARHGT